MKRITIIIALFIALFVPSRSDALPAAWRGTPKFERSGITYRVHDDMHAAVVVKTRGKRVCIPREIRYHGRWYEVRNIWTGALKGAKKVTIHAELEGCDCRRLWKVKRVYVTHRYMYEWLNESGANVRLVDCHDCH